MILSKFKRIIINRLAKRISEENFISSNVKLIDKSYITGSTLIGSVIIEPNCKIFKAYLEGNIEVGKYTSVWGPNICITSKINKVSIGNFCSIARNVSIQEYNHKTDNLSTYHISNNIFNEPITNDLTSKGPIIIGHDVWIGAGAVILSGVTIGNGAIIGANSLISKNVPSFSIVGGNPARILKHRFSVEKISEIEDMKWWYWPIDRIIENRNFFSNKR